MHEKISRHIAKKNGSNKYFTGLPCKNGHISERYVIGNKCVKCKQEIGLKYYESNSDKINRLGKIYRKSEEGKAALESYRKSDKYKKMKKLSDQKYKQSDKGKEARGKYYKSEKGKEAISKWRKTDKAKEWAQKYYKVHRKENVELHSSYTLKYMRSNPQARLANSLRGRVRLALKSQGEKKNAKTTKLIGCEISFLAKHLEKKFQPGMSWDNYGKWHIDHIKPISKFDLTNPEEQRICFHYKNLQPLWAKDNLKKSNKY